MDSFVAAAAGGGVGVTCGRLGGLSRNPSTAFAADGLGFSKHPLPVVAAPVPVPGGCGAGAATSCCAGTPCAPAVPSPPCADAAGYEQGGALFQVMTAPAPPAQVVQGRLVRTVGSYGVGAGCSSASGAPVGFLAWLGPEGVGPPAGSALPTVVLQMDLPGGGQVAYMRSPRALAVSVRPAAGAGGRVVTIVGSGVVVNTVTGVTVLDNQPMMAVVPVCGCALGTPVLLVGNGDDTFAALGSAYYDLAANPCDGGATWYVCGMGLLPGQEATISVAFVALVDGSSGTALALTALDPDGLSFPSSVAVSVAVSSCLVNAAVNDYSVDASPALIWSLAPGTLAPLAPWPMVAMTQYNDPTTLRVKPPVQAQALEAVRLLQDASGRAFLVCRAAVGGVAASGLGLPSQCLVVLFFASDTSPDAAMGALAWGVPDAGATAATIPTDAALLPDGTLAIVGNAFQGGGAWEVRYDATLQFASVSGVALGPGTAGGPWAILVPTWCGRPCATVSTNTTLDALTQPGVQVLLFNLGGCADVRLANAVSVASTRCIQVFGDVLVHADSPAQPAVVLDIVVLLACQPLLQNGATTCCVNKPWGSACPQDGGPLRVDYCCGGPSTLAVSGPIVLGFTSAPSPLVPGTLWYNGDIGRFQAYDNNGDVQTLAWA